LRAPEKLEQRAYLVDAGAGFLERPKVPLDHLVVIALQHRVEQALLAAELRVEAKSVDPELLDEHLRRRSGKSVVTKDLHGLTEQHGAVIAFPASHRGILIDCLWIL